MKRLTSTFLFIFLASAGFARTAPALAQGQYGHDALYYSPAVTEVAMLHLPDAGLRDLLEGIKSASADYSADNFYTPAPQQNSPKVPIPGAIWLLGSGVTGLATIRLRSR